ncbi:hypothetical protein [Nocardioides sp. Arc9.136]|uniref:hypothetical protein n=1 Tax=Nocardioides sp. Arc9.136 TaxID=2996826 RepID=UPI002666D71E|nr:hypothetical protein [Nocardioides sp. Arc9.136]WKN49237.1 hypothetical protein OSR43_03690 [Nocardioides sp. Arc9.136]
MRTGRRRRTTGAGAVAVLAALALAGCSSEPEPLPVGPDGSGAYRSAERITATLPTPDGDGPALGRAEIAPSGDGVRLEVRVKEADTGTWTVALLPGTTCDEQAEAGQDEQGAGLPDLPDLEVGETGSGLLDAELDLTMADLEDGAALVVDGPGGTSCGNLADY